MYIEHLSILSLAQQVENILPGRSREIFQFFRKYFMIEQSLAVTMRVMLKSIYLFLCNYQL